MWTLLDHCHRAQPQSKHWVFPEKHLWCLDKTIMLLFWFDYLTADVLDVLMCIEKVQNKTRHPCPTLLLSSQWTENMFRLPVITVCLVPSFDNAQALFIRNLIHQWRIHFFAADDETQGCWRTPKIWAAGSIQQLENSRRPLTDCGCAVVNQCMARAVVWDETGECIWYPGRLLDNSVIVEPIYTIDAQRCGQRHITHVNFSLLPNVFPWTALPHFTSQRLTMCVLGHTYLCICVCGSKVGSIVFVCTQFISAGSPVPQTRTQWSQWSCPLFQQSITAVKTVMKYGLQNSCTWTISNCLWLSVSIFLLLSTTIFHACTRLLWLNGTPHLWTALELQGGGAALIY